MQMNIKCEQNTKNPDLPPIAPLHKISANIKPKSKRHHPKEHGIIVFDPFVCKAKWNVVPKC